MKTDKEYIRRRKEIRKKYAAKGLEICYEDRINIFMAISQLKKRLDSDQLSIEQEMFWAMKWIDSLPDESTEKGLIDQFRDVFGFKSSKTAAFAFNVSESTFNSLNYRKPGKTIRNSLLLIIALAESMPLENRRAILENCIETTKEKE